MALTGEKTLCLSAKNSDYTENPVGFKTDGVSILQKFVQSLAKNRT